MNKLETNRAIIGEFRDLIADKVRISDVNGWSNRLVYNHLIGYKNKILMEKMKDPKSSISILNYQTLPCVALDEISIEECPCQPASDFKFLRSIVPIPNYIGDIKSVNSGTRSQGYDYVDWDNFRYKLNSRFEAERTQPYWTIRKVTVNNVTGNYLYIHNDIFREFVTVSAIFSDPLDVYKYPNCEGKVDKCLSALDKEFIIDPQFKPLMFDLALSQLVRAKTPISDVVNNNLDDVSNNRNPLK